APPVGRFEEALPEREVGDRVALRVAKSLAFPRRAPLGQALEDVLAVGHELDLGTGRNQGEAFDGRGQLGDLVGAEADVAEVIRLRAVRRDKHGAPSGGAGIGRRARAVGVGDPFHHPMMPAVSSLSTDTWLAFGVIPAGAGAVTAFSRASLRISPTSRIPRTRFTATM